jgi:hypothetical protein
MYCLFEIIYVFTLIQTVKHGLLGSGKPPNNATNQLKDTDTHSAGGGADAKGNGGE